MEPRVPFEHVLKNGVAYQSCPGCHWAYEDVPEAYLPAIKGRDCGCPCGSGVTIRKAEPLPEKYKDALARVEAGEAEALPSKEALEFVIRELHRKRNDGPEKLTKRNEALCVAVAEYLYMLFEKKEVVDGR